MRRLVLTLALVYRFIAPLAAIVLPMLLRIVLGIVMIVVSQTI